MIDEKNQNKDGEISLIDLWLVLVRQKKIIIATVLLSLILGVIVAVTQQDKYIYRASMEIGKYFIGGKSYPLEYEKTIQNKVTEVYLLQALKEYNIAHPEVHKNWRLKVSRSAGSQILTIEGEGGKGAFYLSVLQSVINKIKRSHRRIMQNIKREHDIRLRKLVYQADAQEDQEKLFEARKKRINEKAELIKKNIKMLELMLKTEEHNIKKIMREKVSEVGVMVLLMLNNRTMLIQDKLIGLKQDLLFSIPNERDFLDERIGDVYRHKMEIKDKLLLLKIAFDKNQETEVISPPGQYRAPPNLYKKQIVIMAIIMGGIVGLLIAFFLEFIKKARVEYDARIKNV